MWWRDLRGKLRDLMQEEYWALLLTSAGTVLKEVKVTVGTLNSSLVHPRECLHDAVKRRAANVIFLHNHPSGNPERSQEDFAVTRQLVEAG
jgi:DNA repair protein RadC